MILYRNTTRLGLKLRHLASLVTGRGTILGKICDCLGLFNSYPPSSKTYHEVRRQLHNRQGALNTACREVDFNGAALLLFSETYMGTSVGL